MKKLTALLLAVLMVFVFSACQPAASTAPETEETAPAEEQPAAPEEPAGEEAPAEESTGPKPGDDLTTLTVGTPEMNGDFITGFGSNAYDVYIRNLIWGDVATVTETTAGELVVNETVVADYTAETDAAGNKTYTWTINDGLLWNDGTPITAQDFVFSSLLGACPEWVTAGAAETTGDLLLGYKEYHDGSADTFAGIQLIDDKTFSMTIAAENLPYFWELSAVLISPRPMAYYCPDATIESSEAGAKIVDDNLQEDLQNVANNVRFAPEVTCGPYNFVSFENQTATTTINENFCGTFEGKKPTIQNVVVKSVPQDTDHQAIIAGDIDLAAGEIEGFKINAIKAATDTAKYSSYLRNGYGILTMCCDWGPTADPNVRWALAYLIDRNAAIDYVCEGYGGVVQAEYSYAEWMYDEAGADLEEELTPFNLNIDEANKRLDMTEWKYESDGVTPFDATKANAEGTYLRYNAEGEPLVINHLGTEENSVTDIIEIQYAQNAPLAGVDFKVTKGDFNVLLDNYYYGYEMEDSERIYNSFNLASNFGNPHDYYYSWHSDMCGSSNNANQLSDPELDKLIEQIRALDPTQKDEFIDLWLQLMKRWQDDMPLIPLYCNEYFNFAYKTVFGIENITSFADWSEVICDITKQAA